MTLLRDLINIPERVQTNDFVLKLSEGVTEARGGCDRRQLRGHAPAWRSRSTKRSASSAAAVESGRSAACYLDGSFGSGKSHFMAVLDLLLAGNVRARSKPELAEVVARHHAILNGRKFLMVPFHMIGAHDVETAILGGYADHVRRLHPDAPVPGFYLGERLFDDARRLRTTMGDAAFFEKLNAAGRRRRRRLGRFRRPVGRRLVRVRRRGATRGRGTPAARRRPHRRILSPPMAMSRWRRARPFSTSTAGSSS